MAQWNQKTANPSDSAGQWHGRENDAASVIKKGL
jgi:hypothetical protein